jgi:3-hydroxyisobutyrate dehydrogenase-like beta-hydroxyacid dehydrogenase
MSVVGLLHPGEMGAAIGNALVGAGHTVLWASEGRSDATRARAAAFEDAGTVTELAARSDVVFSVVPPHASRDVAAAVQPFRGIYVDANAVAPETARSLGAPRFVDGGIVGGPPAPHLYLSGEEAGAVAELFDGSALATFVVADASALKCAYAAWTKGSAALQLAAREYARRTGVEAALLAEWEQLGLRPDESRVAAKAWRFVGEMEEIANAFADEDLPPGFHEAAAEIYRSIGRPTVNGSVNDGGSSE